MSNISPCRAQPPFDLPQAALVANALGYFDLPTGRKPQTMEDLRIYLEQALRAFTLEPAKFFSLSAAQLEEAPQTARRTLTEGYRANNRHWEAWPLHHPIDWCADPHHDRNWRAQLNTWRHLIPVMAVEHCSSDDSYWRAIIDTVHDWLAFHVLQPHPHHNPMAWKDSLTGMRGTILLYLLYRLVTRKAATDESDFAVVVVLLAEHFERLTRWDFLSISNHGIPQVHALKVCSTILPSLFAARDVRGFAHRALDRLVRHQFSEEGLHLEHSPAYHRFSLQRFRKFFATGYYSDEKALSSILDLAQTRQRWMYHPNKSVVRIGDSLSSIEQITDPGDVSASFVRPASPPREQAATFKETGYCVIRNRPDAPAAQGFCLFFSGAFHSQIHKHSDDMCFEWFDRGRSLLIDTGKHSYNVDDLRRYAVSTRAHNTLEIDGRDFSRKQAHAYGSALKRVWKTALGTAVHGRVLHRDFQDGRLEDPVLRDRLLVYQPNRWLLVVDAVQAATTHRYVQWHHLAPDLTVRSDGRIADERGNILLRVQSACSSSAIGITGRGQTMPGRLGWTTVAYGKSTPTTAFGQETEAGSALLATLFTIGDESGQFATINPTQAIVSVGDIAATIQLLGTQFVVETKDV